MFVLRSHVRCCYYCTIGCTVPPPLPTSTPHTHTPRARKSREAPAEEPHRERIEGRDHHVQPEVELFPSDEVRILHVPLSNVRLGLEKTERGYGRLFIFMFCRAGLWED